MKALENQVLLSGKLQQQELTIQRLVVENDAQEQANRLLTARISRLEHVTGHPDKYSKSPATPTSTVSHQPPR